MYSISADTQLHATKFMKKASSLAYVSYANKIHVVLRPRLYVWYGCGSRSTSKPHISGRPNRVHGRRRVIRTRSVSSYYTRHVADKWRGACAAHWADWPHPVGVRGGTWNCRTAVRHLIYLT